MTPGRSPGFSGTHGPGRGHEDAHALRLLADKGQSADDSDSAFGCESSGCDPSPSSIPEEGYRSVFKTRGPASSSRSSGSAVNAPHPHRDPSSVVPPKRRKEATQRPTSNTGSSAGTTRTADKSFTGTTRLAPRNLRSKTPPRVAWVSGKFIRELGSEDHPSPQLVSVITHQGPPIYE